MGEVWLAHDPRLDRRVAIKLMLRQLAEDPQFVARFYREARAVARLNHPNIIGIHQIGEEHGVLFFVMEWVEGESLSDRIHRTGPLPLADALHVILQTVDALEYAHDNGVIHRDIKPANLMFGAGTRLKVTDFGLAKVTTTDAQMTSSGVPLGSPTYMSPEQVHGEPADHRSDIYSLGITFFQLLTGEAPFRGASTFQVMMKHVQETLPEPEPLARMLGGSVMEVIRRMTAKSAADRHATYAGLRADLVRIRDAAREAGDTVAALAPGCWAPPAGQSSGAITPQPTASSAAATPATPPPAAPPRNRLRNLLLAAVAVILVVSVAFTLGRTSREPSRRRANVARAIPAEAAVLKAASPAEDLAGDGDADDLPGRIRRPLARRSEALRDMPAAGWLLQRFPPYAGAYDSYDFREMARILGQAKGIVALPATRRASAEQLEAAVNQLLPARERLAEEAARPGARAALKSPRHGMLALAGAGNKGIRFQDPAGAETTLTWEDLTPVEFRSLMQQLLPPDEYAGYVEPFERVFPSTRSRPPDPLGEAPPPRQPQPNRQP
jgi:hypothetical protein